MMKMCDIIKELRALQRYGDKSEQNIAKRMLNGLYGEKVYNEEVERITLLQYLKTVVCDRVSLKMKENWCGMSCLVDLGQFNVIKDDTLFAIIALVKEDGTFAPQELYNLYINKFERNPMAITYYIELTSKPYFDTDIIKGETNGNND